MKCHVLAHLTQLCPPLPPPRLSSPSPLIQRHVGWERVGFSHARPWFSGGVRFCCGAVCTWTRHPQSSVVYNRGTGEEREGGGKRGTGQKIGKRLCAACLILGKAELEFIQGGERVRDHVQLVSHCPDSPCTAPDHSSTGIEKAPGTSGACSVSAAIL